MSEPTTEQKWKMMEGASYLLPDPGGEVVRDLLQQLRDRKLSEDSLRKRVEELEAALIEIANCECMECPAPYIAKEAIGGSGGEL
jgi:hypothetical protein